MGLQMISAPPLNHLRTTSRTTLLLKTKVANHLNHVFAFSTLLCCFLQLSISNYLFRWFRWFRWFRYSIDAGLEANHLRTTLGEVVHA